MKIKTDYEILRDSSPETRRLLKQEELLLDVCEALVSAMEQQEIQRSELAQRLGKSKGFISQVLSGGRNLTLRTLSDIADGLGLAVSLSLPQEQIGTSSHTINNVVWPRPKQWRRADPAMTHLTGEYEDPENEQLAAL